MGGALASRRVWSRGRGVGLPVAGMSSCGIHIYLDASYPGPGSQMAEQWMWTWKGGTRSSPTRIPSAPTANDVCVGGVESGEGSYMRSGREGITGGRRG